MDKEIKKMNKIDRKKFDKHLMKVLELLNENTWVLNERINMTNTKLDNLIEILKDNAYLSDRETKKIYEGENKKGNYQNNSFDF